MKIIRKYYRKLRRHVIRNPARSAGYFSTFTLIIDKTFDFKSTSLLIFLGAVMIGVGESAQREEDKKTIAAIYVKNDGEVPDKKIIDSLRF
jgi:hypothetical protein